MRPGALQVTSRKYQALTCPTCPTSKITAFFVCLNGHIVLVARNRELGNRGCYDMTNSCDSTISTKGRIRAVEP